MGKVDRLRNRVEPFLFWALGILLANTWLCPTAQHHSTAGHKACPTIVIVGSILSKDALPPPLFLSRYIINLCLYPSTHYPFTLGSIYSYSLAQNSAPLEKLRYPQRNTPLSLYSWNSTIPTPWLYCTCALSLVSNSTNIKCRREFPMFDLLNRAVEEARKEQPPKGPNSLL